MDAETCPKRVTWRASWEFSLSSDRSATLCFFCARTLAVSSSSVGSRPRTQSWCAVCVMTLTHYCTAVLASHWNKGMLCRRRALLETYQQKKITIWSIMRVLCAFFGSGWNLQSEICWKEDWIIWLLHDCGPFQIFTKSLCFTPLPSGKVPCA